MNATASMIWGVLIVALVTGGVLGYYIGLKSTPKDTSLTIEDVMSDDKQIALYTSMRTLWSDHVFWTREYLDAAINDSLGANAAAVRLMKNQEDIGNAITVYYGAAVGAQLTTLLKEHISIAVDIVTAVKANNQNAFQNANARWQDNADEIATFLSEANPNWPEADIADMMTVHLKTTADELSAIQNKQYEKSVSDFDTVHRHIVGMADALSAGIIKQFPDKFK